MTDIVKGILEDTRKGILLNNFDGGIVTDTGGLSLASNQSPDALNVFAWEGNLHFRGGYAAWCTLPAGTDGAFTYTDVNDNAHMVEWAGGSMYDVSAGGSPVLIRANCYSPGQTIAHAQLNGRLYWATLTVPLRQWDGTTEQAVTNAGGIGVVPPPACSFLVALNGALVAVDYVVAGIRQAGAFIWCDVNNPNKWVGANTQTVGSNDGGICVFAIVMGVAQVGVAPIKQFMVGKNNRQIFLYEGALGSLTENAVSSPVGIIDGQTAVYMPTKQGLGAVMFLGDDAQFYLCNGIECTVASENIKLLTNNLVNAAYELNPGQRFNAVYNQRFQYYLCDFGNNTQLAYKWDTGAWWLFQGWPSGVYATMPTNNGLPTIFVGANFGSTTGVYELALDQTDDNGTDITAYWTSPYIHGGKPERLKIYQEVTLFAYNIGVQYAVTGYGFPRSDGVVPQTTTMLMNDPAVGATPILSGSVWGQFYWGQGYWTGGQPTSLTQPYSIGGVKSPLIVPSVATKWARAGVPQPFRSGGAQFKIAWNGGVPDFRVTSFKIALLFQNEAVGVLPFSGQGQVTNVSPNWGNRFTNRGAPTSTPPRNVPVPAHHSAFLPLPSMHTYPGYARLDGPCFGGSLITLSADKLHLFVLCQDTAQNNFFVLKISTVTGAIEASISTPTMGFISNEANLFMSPVNPNVVYVLWSYGTPLNITLWELNANTMTLNRSVALDGTNPSSLAAAAISADGTTMAVQENGATNSEIYIVDLAAFTATSFAQPPNTGTNNRGCAFVPGSNSEVLVGDLTALEQITRYTTGGAVVTTYALGLPEPIVDLSTSSGSPLVFGWSTENFPTPPRVFAYNLGTAALTTAVASNGSPDDQACIVPVGARVYTQQNNLAEVIKFDGAASSSASFPSSATQQHWNGLAIDSTHGIIYTAGDLNDGVNYPLIVQAIALF